MPHAFVYAPLALVPVLVFLAAMLFFDSYKLVSFREVVMTLTAGAVLAVVGYFVNGALSAAMHMSFADYSHNIAPLVEEGLKAIAVFYLFARNRVGFLIDAAIMGFAVGTGFALVENFYLLFAFPDASPVLWMVRGFGTAIMHGGATALFALFVQALIERRMRPAIVLGVVAFLMSVGLHALFNHLASLPLVATVMILILLPILFMLVFTKSEHGVHEWLWHDYETHQHLLAEIRSGAYRDSPNGRFIEALSQRFSEEMAAVIFEYIQLHTELVLRSEQISIARERGETLPVVQEDKDKFKRMHALAHNIGWTAMLVLWPHLHFTRRELWELSELEHELWRVRA